MNAGSHLDGRADLAVVFASPHFAADARVVVDAVHEAVGPNALIGCIAQGIVGGGREYESTPAVAAWLACLPEPVHGFHLDSDEVATGGRDGNIVLIADPFTFRADTVLTGINERAPGTLVIGGLAGGAREPGGTRLFCGDEVLASGAVGVRLPGSVRVLTSVSQGCKPVGKAQTVTKAEHNLIYELAGEPPMTRIRELHAQLDPDDQGLMQHGLLVGRVIDEYNQDPQRGDFLVRPAIGADPESGAIAIGDVVEPGQTIRIHVRDAHSAHEDLTVALARARATLSEPPAGALMFTCNGRGRHMFGVPDHDVSVVTEQLGDLPVAGFFAAGELGPVGGRNFLHGFTASLAIFASS